MNPMQEYLLVFLINPNTLMTIHSLTDMFFYMEAKERGFIKNGRLTQAGYDYMTLQENDDGTV